MGIDHIIIKEDNFTKGNYDSINPQKEKENINIEEI